MTSMDSVGADHGMVRELTDHEIAWVSGGEAGLNYSGGTVTGPCMSLANLQANAATARSLGKDTATFAAVGFTRQGPSGILGGAVVGLVAGVVKLGYDLLTGVGSVPAPVCDAGVQAPPPPPALEPPAPPGVADVMIHYSYDGEPIGSQEYSGSLQAGGGGGNELLYSGTAEDDWITFN